MNEILIAALPWLIGGISIGKLYSNLKKLKNRAEFEDGKNINDTYAGEGVTCGMCLGIAVSIMFSIGLGLTLLLGILAGLAFGTSFKKPKR